MMSNFLLSISFAIFLGLLVPKAVEGAASGTLYSKANPTLQAALDEAGFKALLDDPTEGPFTLFEPESSAFDPYLPDILYAYNVDILSTILKHHVLKEDYLASEIEGKRKTLNKDKVKVDIEALTVTSSSGNSAAIIKPDVETQNGVIHAIDSVLIPKNADIPEYPTILQSLKNKGSFSTLISLLEQYDLDSTLDSSSENGYTLFAPNDKAFEKLFASLTEEELAQVDVLAVLQYHVLPAAEERDVIRKKYKKEEAVTLLGSEASTLKIKGCKKIKTGSGQTVDIKGGERRTLNGYINVVKDVLLP